MLDPVKNFAEVTVSTGYDASATTIVLESGEGSKLPDPSTDGEFNLTWFNYTDYPNPSNDPNKEIVRCTAKSTDTLTVQRPASGNNYNGEGSDNTASTKNEGGKTYKMILGATKKTIDDIGDLQSDFVIGETPSESPDGSETNFSTASVFAENTEEVFKNGVRMKRGSGNDYTVDSDKQGVTFETAPNTGDIIQVNYVKASSAMIVGSNSTVIGESPSGSINGSNTDFVISQTPLSESIEVFLNGQRLTLTEDYTVSGTTISFVTAPETGDIIRVNYLFSGSATHNADTVDGYHFSDLKSDILSTIYPVGSIYFNATDDTNPATLLGFGTWTAFGGGKVPVGQHTGDTDFDTLEETGGEKTVTLTADQSGVPAHTHSLSASWKNAGSSYDNLRAIGYGTTIATSDTATIPKNASANASESHNNLQPYIVVKMWKRVS